MKSSEYGVVDEATSPEAQGLVASSTTNESQLRERLP